MGSAGFRVAALAGALALGALALPIAEAERPRRADGGALVAAANAADRNPSAAAWRRLAERYRAHADRASPAGRRLYLREAARAYREAARRGPAHARTWLQLADLAQRRGESAREAAAFLAQASRAAPRHPAYLPWRARRALELWTAATAPDRRVLADQIARAWRADPEALRAHAGAAGLTRALRTALTLSGEGER
jgi:tetratricopeptide (TPR) repeat protein